MNILGLESSTEQGSVALSCNGEVFQQAWQGGRGHAEGILKQVSALLAQHSLSLAQLDAIAFSQGPGSFTGVRTACGMAQGLSLGANVPLVPVPTLMVLAEAAKAQRVVTILDARMGQVYLAAYERDEQANWNTVIQPQLAAPDSLPQLPGPAWEIIGNGVGLCSSLLENQWHGQWVNTRPECYPEARNLLTIAARQLSMGHTCLPEEVAPLYLRDKVALTVEERRVSP